MGTSLNKISNQSLSPYGGLVPFIRLNVVIFINLII